jgi:hypothetical protein
MTILAGIMATAGVSCLILNRDERQINCRLKGVNVARNSERKG